MAQGKAFTAEQREEIIQSLQSSLELGYSRNKACELIGLPPQTLSNWVQEDEALGMKLRSWESAVNTMVMANIVDAIRKEGELENDIKKENSWKWATTKMKDEGFSSRSEHTGADGKDLLPTDELKEVAQQAVTNYLNGLTGNTN